MLFIIVAVFGFLSGYVMRAMQESENSQVLPEVTGTILFVKGDPREVRREAVFISKGGKKFVALDSFNDVAKGRRCVFSEPYIKDGRLIYTKAKYVE